MMHYPLELLKMSNTHMSPRLTYLDASTARMAFENRHEHAPKLLAMIASDPKKLPQQRYSSLASDYESIALFSYALGHPFDAVINSFQSAVQAFVKVFRLRGTQRPFEAYVVEPLGNRTDGAEFDIRPLNDADSRDFSLTNSRKGYYAVCEALIVGDQVAAKELAGLIWDPPDASYIGPSSFCTPDDQGLAYALRAFYEGRTTDVETALNGITPRSDEIGSQVAMLRALKTGDETDFLEGLDSLLRWHETEASSKKNRRAPEFFLSVPGLGLSCLALRDGLCQPARLPIGNPFLPCELLGVG